MELTDLLKKRRIKKALRSGWIFNRNANCLGTEDDVKKYADYVTQSNYYINQNNKQKSKLSSRQLSKLIKLTNKIFNEQYAPCSAENSIKILRSYNPCLGWNVLKNYLKKEPKCGYQSLSLHLQNLKRSNICVRIEAELIEKLINENLQNILSHTNPDVKWNNFKEDLMQNKNLIPEHIERYSCEEDTLNNVFEYYKSQREPSIQINKKIKIEPIKIQNQESSEQLLPSALSIANLLNKYCSKLNSNIAYSAKKINEYNQISNNEFKLCYSQMETVIKTITKNYNLENKKSILADGIAHILQAMPCEKITENMFTEFISFLDKGFFSRLLKRKKKFGEEYEIMASILWQRQEIYC